MMILDALDARLKDAVLKELRADVRVNEAEIGVAVEHGVVTLTGRVATDAEKLAAEHAAHRAAGVLDVANDIRVKAPFRLGRSDTDLAEAVRHALRHDVPSAADRIRSTVDDACITLEGTVAAPREREEAERAVQRLAGVLRVDNRIEVRAGAGAPGARRTAVED
jgi:osmotically-inducible protein OsmY